MPLNRVSGVTADSGGTALAGFPRFSGSDQPIRREEITVAKYRHDRINEEMYRVAAEILRTVRIRA
ncbi:MAG: hypothetical protein L6V84_02080 [Oscillospiraceae bacterium]|nr:MAG: hypothetical protein L6V84_02080 [Oscillospiraceae bacterium]